VNLTKEPNRHRGAMSRDLDHRRIDAINARPGHESKGMSELVQGVGFREGA
jgi:hypothetical protein